jgi:hypothetical protein
MLLLIVELDVELTQHPAERLPTDSGGDNDCCYDDDDNDNDVDDDDDSDDNYDNRDHDDGTDRDDVVVVLT